MNSPFNTISRVELAALYLSLFSASQVEDIILAITGDAAGVRSAYQTARSSKIAPPAVLAFAGRDRNEAQDIPDLIRGIALMFYGALKQSWSRDDYKNLIIKLYGVSEAVAMDYAKLISTNDHEATTAFLARMAKKVGDLMLGPLWDPDTTPPNPDIGYETLLLGRQGAELTKRITSVAAFAEDLLPTTLGIRTPGTTGLNPAGDLSYLPDEAGDVEVVVDPDAFGDYLSAFGDYFNGDVLREEELGAVRKKRGGFANFIKKMKNVVRKIAKSPLLKNALKMIPGVGNVVSAIDTTAGAVKELTGDVIIPDQQRMVADAPSAVSRELRYGDAAETGGALKIDIQHEKGEVIIPSQPVLNRDFYGPGGPTIIRN